MVKGGVGGRAELTGGRSGRSGVKNFFGLANFKIH